jgi:hypothetical protein
MQILKGTGTDWRKRKLISKLYMEQCVKVRLDQGEMRSVKIGRGVKTRLLFVADSIQLIQQVPYQGSP